MPLAWMLRDNDPETLLDTGLDGDTTNKIGFLIKSLNLGEETDADTLSDMLTGYQKSGLSSRKLKEWLRRVGGKDGGIVDAFINYSKSPRIKLFMNADDGSESPSPQFEDLIDPFTGAFDSEMVTARKRGLEHKNFMKELSFMKPV